MKIFRYSISHDEFNGVDASQLQDLSQVTRSLEGFVPIELNDADLLTRDCLKGLAFLRELEIFHEDDVSVSATDVVELLASLPTAQLTSLKVGIPEACTTMPLMRQIVRFSYLQQLDLGAKNFRKGNLSVLAKLSGLALLTLHALDWPWKEGPARRA